MTEHNTTAPTDFDATDSDGNRIDLRDLTTAELDAYRSDAASHGDTNAVATIDWIIQSRGEA